MEVSYTTRAIDALNAYPETAFGKGIKDRLIDGLRSSVKFRLPTNGELVTNSVDVHDSFLGVYRLPFPKIVAEFDVDLLLGENDHEGAIQPKKVVTYAEHINDIPEFAASLEMKNGHLLPSGSGYFLHSNFLAPDGVWAPSPFAAIAPYEHDHGRVTAKGLMKIPLFCFDLGGSFGKICNLTPHQMATEYYLDVTAVLNIALCSLCENVEHETVKAPKYTNTTRRKKNKEPFYEYKILKVKGQKSHDGGSKRGSGVRLHMRRGHIRRLPNGGLTWVRHTVVGDKSRGVVMKEYNLT